MVLHVSKEGCRFVIYTCHSGYLICLQAELKTLGGKTEFVVIFLFFEKTMMDKTIISEFSGLTEETKHFPHADSLGNLFRVTLCRQMMVRWVADERVLQKASPMIGDGVK